MNRTALLSNMGGVSNTEKMPCYSWSLSAYECKTGGKLAKVPGSVCAGCYAMKGNYLRYKNSVTKSHEKKLAAWKADRKLWVESFTEWFSKFNGSAGNNPDLFRWFDSGDLYDLNMLLDIVEIANNCPDVKFWLPTKEYKLINFYKKVYGAFPENLRVRVSAPMLEQNINGYEYTSSVSSENYNCHAYKNGGKCLDCTLCWDKTKNVTYKLH